MSLSRSVEAVVGRATGVVKVPLRTASRVIGVVADRLPGGHPPTSGPESPARREDPTPPDAPFQERPGA